MSTHVYFDISLKMKLIYFKQVADIFSVIRANNYDTKTIMHFILIQTLPCFVTAFSNLDKQSQLISFTIKPDITMVFLWLY